MGLATPVMAIFFAATFLFIWKYGGLGQHVLGFAASYYFFGLGLLIAVTLSPDSRIGFMTSHLAYSLASAALVWSLCARVGQRAYLVLLAAIYLVAASGLAVIVNVAQDFGPSLVFSNTGYGLMLLVGLVGLLSSPRRKIFDQLIIAVLAINVADFLVRPTLTLVVGGGIDIVDYHESFYFSLINLVLNVKAVMTAAVLFGACAADYVAKMRASSSMDHLTGLKSRRAFETDARAMMKRGEDEGRSVAMIMADIDHFKQVNDLWGHQAGDKAIASFGRLIEGTVRGCDISARIGGEEFCIIAWNCDEAVATNLAERIRSAFAQASHEGISPEIRLTASFGVAQARAGERYEELFARVDESLYHAKEGGRDQVVSDRRSTPRRSGRVHDTAVDMRAA